MTDCWLECAGQCSGDHGAWHVVPRAVMAAHAAPEAVWRCVRCADETRFPAFQGDEAEWAVQLGSFFDVSSQEWRRNKVVVYSDAGARVGFRYKTKRESRLWQRGSD